MRSFMADMNLLKLALGTLLLAAAWLVFSIWREKLGSLKEEDRVDFLMYRLAGGSWLVAVFALCGGFYFLLEPMLH